MFRGEALPLVCEGRRLAGISGTHGKTTTTAMIAGLLRHAGLDPGWCVGGEPPGLGAVAEPGVRRGSSARCDGRRDARALPPEIGVVTNIGSILWSHFSGEEEVLDCFKIFASRSSRLVACADDAQAVRLLDSARDGLSYGFAPGAAVQGVDVHGDADFIEARVEVGGRPAGVLRLNIAGRHNLQNALGALAVGISAGIAPADLLGWFPDFRSVDRRFQWLVRSGPVQVVSDYAHHPTEIRTVLDVARRCGRRLVAVFQPHRYTRTKLLGPLFPPAFDGLDHLVLAPVYAASEPELEGGRSDDLFAALQARARVSCELATSLDDAWARLRAILREGDLLLVIGAGDVDRIAALASREFSGQPRQPGTPP
ncbi:MAG: cyanophycin synthetase [Kiritimatiellia bacterium]